MSLLFDIYFIYFSCVRMGKHALVHVWTSVELIFYSHLSVGYHDGTLVRPFQGPVNPFTKQNEDENRRSYRSFPHIAQEKVLFKEELCELSKFALERGGFQSISAIERDSTVQSDVVTVSS